MTKNVIAGTEYQLLLRCNPSLTLTEAGYLLKMFELDMMISVFSVLNTNISPPHHICAFHY